MTPEDAAQLYPVVQEECEALRQRLSARIKAQENAGRLLEDWQRVADQQREEIEGLRRELQESQLEVIALHQGILDALQFEVEENMQRFSPMADRLRALAGLPPEEPPPITEAMAALREAVGGAYDGVDPVEHVRELRG